MMALTKFCLIVSPKTRTWPSSMVEYINIFKPNS